MKKIIVYKNHDKHLFGKIFQIRLKEALGRPECPYLFRWSLIIFGFTIRLHHWIKSDDRRFFHDHSCDLISIIIKGWYYNVIPDENGNPVKHLAQAWKPRRMKAEQRHYLDIPKGGAWTILLCSRPYHKWGFYVNNHKWRPLRYFSKYGIIQDENYQ
jgi:hypothetical protein